VSNIIFSNGALDPWHAGGVNYNVSDQAIAIYIYQSAHHLDLREPKAADPDPVVEARDIERAWISKWITEYSNITPTDSMKLQKPFVKKTEKQTKSDVFLN